MTNAYTQTETGLNAFYAKIYGFVGLGLCLSAVVAGAMLTVFQHQMIAFLQAGRFMVLGVWLVQIALVTVASTAAAKNSPAALPLFLTYSALTGFTLSLTLAYYTFDSILAAFLSAAAVFFAMALIGRVTKRDLSGLGKAFMAALIGLIIASLLNFFLRSSALSFGLSIVSVLIFSGLIAYDNQRIKQVYLQLNGQVQDGWAISMALSLYLDFINLFLNLLRLFGSRD